MQLYSSSVAPAHSFLASFVVIAGPGHLAFGQLVDHACQVAAVPVSFGLEIRWPFSYCGSGFLGRFPVLSGVVYTPRHLAGG